MHGFKTCKDKIINSAKLYFTIIHLWRSLYNPQLVSVIYINLIMIVILSNLVTQNHQTYFVDYPIMCVLAVLLWHLMCPHDYAYYMGYW